MKPLLSLLMSLGLSNSPMSSRQPRHRREARRQSTRQRPLVEALEDRAVPSVMLAISDAAATEGDANYHYTDDFVAPDAYGLAAARNIRIGQDGNIYVASHDTDVVKVFDSVTGQFLRDLGTPGGELDGPWGMTFGPDGLLYVGGRYSHNVVRFDVATGVSEVFVSPGSGGLQEVPGMTFGPDGYLYASSKATGDWTIKRYDGGTGAYMGDFVGAGSGGLQNPTGVKFGPDGNLYVCNGNNGSVLRYNGRDGSFKDTFIAPGAGGLYQPSALLFHTDGLLYVCSGNGQEIWRYNASSGDFVDVFASGRPTSDVAFAASGQAYISVDTPTLTPGSAVIRYAPGSSAAFTIQLDTASPSPVSVNFATGNMTATAGSDYTSFSATLIFAPGQTSRTVLVPTLNDSTGEPTETFVLNLSDPVGATIADGQGVGTIIDDDATKFYVVDDGSTDRTYRYGAPGNALANSTLASGNTGPRGAAANAAGTTLWVADASGTVYVYNAAGALLGSWSAGGLPAKAQVEGIATNGTNIWLVDAKQDKVFKYTGAASRTTGSQSPASSFSLASGNGDPKDIVTDGTSLWVVNDAATDKVFKYTLSGTSLGNWTMTGGGGSPTGITLDPSAPSALWVVDSATDRVYQYDSAVGWTSGSHAASGSFALAAGNTNPQGIADPPPPDMLPSPPAVPAVSAALPAAASVPSPADRDAVFALLALHADRTGTPASASGSQQPVDHLTPLIPATTEAVAAHHSAVALPDVALIDKAREAPTVATDCLFTRLVDDTPPGE